MSAVEAFHLMWYECPCGHRERIWNSREGVTPFCLPCPSCGEGSLRHVEWNRDEEATNHVPHFGQRIFVNLTMERARERAEASVAYHHDKLGVPLPDEMTRAELVERVAKHEYESFGAGNSPDVAVVEQQVVPNTWGKD